MEDMATAPAYVNRNIIQWARERALLTKTRLAKLLGTTEVEIDSWESGGEHPSLKKALDFSRVAHIPFGYLFLAAPPVETLPLPDLRRRVRDDLRTPTVNFRDILQEVTLKQQWFRSFTIANEAAPLPFVGRFNLQSRVAEVADDIRNTLGITEELRKEASGPADYLRLIVTNSEEAGILVMRSGVVGANNQRPLSTDEFSGFAISDPFAPVVFINVNEPPTAQVFTCVHELAHIWMGASGISDAVAPDSNRPRLNDIETFCDAVAAEFLIPTKEFASVWNRFRNEAGVASYFRVSQQVALRRAHDLNAISTSEFFRRWNAIPKGKSTTAKKKGGNFHNTLPARNSIKLTTTLLAEVRNGRVLHRDAARLLGVKPTTLPKIAKMRLGE
jgi:Zn-dependent peptidase ImmA (M78 family)/DNA-binding XRE family transcriptional regulator